MAPGVGSWDIWDGQLLAGGGGATSCPMSSLWIMSWEELEPVGARSRSSGCPEEAGCWHRGTHTGVRPAGPCGLDGCGQGCEAQFPLEAPASKGATVRMQGRAGRSKHRRCLCFSFQQPNIGRLGLPHGPSGEKVAVVTVDDCDTAVAVRFGNLVGNYSCAAQGTQSGSKK